MSFLKINIGKKTQFFPLLRFKEFKDEFKLISISDISNITRGKGILKIELTDKTGKYDCIHYSELTDKTMPFFTKTFLKTNNFHEIISSGNDVLINCISYTGIYVYSSLKKEGIIIGDDIFIIRLINKYNSDYISLVLNSKKNKSLNVIKVHGLVAKRLSPNFIKKVKLSITENKNEQNKIINFFTKILEKIDLEINLKNKREMFLKSLNEKTFEKNKDINKYYIFNDELKKFFSFFTGLENNTVHTKEKYKNKLLPYAIVRDKTICDSKDLIPFIGKGNPKSILNNNDILFISDSGYKNIGINSIYSSNVEAFLSRCCIGMRLKEKFNNVIYPKYINTLFSWNKYRRKVKSLATGSVIYGINAKKLENIKIKIPNFKILNRDKRSMLY